MSKGKNKKKSFVDLVQSVRRFWDINPRTRVQENEKKNKKKRREEGKKTIRDLE